MCSAKVGHWRVEACICSFGGLNFHGLAETKKNIHYPVKYILFVVFELFQGFISVSITIMAK